MGDLVGAAVDGELYYIKRHQFDRVRRLNAETAEVTALFADMARLNALYMIATAGSGHIGSSFSSMDLFAHLQLNEVDTSKGDKFFSSKGHDAPGLYAIMMAVGLLDEGLIHSLRRLDGLPGHPDVGTKGIVANTGSLGMGISKAKGMALAARLKGRPIKVCVVTGDGELQEGQIWESLVSAANWRMGEITVVVDHNKIQSDYSVERTSSLGDLAAKFAAFGWHVERIDGHDTRRIAETFERLNRITDRPKAVIADTVKGKGVSFMEGTSIDSDVEMFQFHSGAPQAADYTRAAQELLDRINGRAERLGGESVEIETINRPKAAPAPGRPVGLFGAYTEALLKAAARRPELVALDADLIKDMGLIPFAEAHPDRFFECGIAEQDMVSMAGGMALSGLLPVAHSFSCFLSTRPNEQIYNNATEHTKVVYVGGLSGVLPAGPGHSHQSVREISAVGGVPGLAMVAPSCPGEVGPLLDWCLDAHDGPSFLRMASLPADIDWDVPAGWRPEPGKGFVITDGADAVLVGSGPTLLAQAVKAARVLAEEGIGLQVVNLPWLNRVDGGWLASVAGGKRLLVTLDDHYVDGGQGEKVLAALAAAGAAVPCLQLGLTAVPPSGQPGEVLERLGLDAAGIAASVRGALAQSGS
jgi:transketolase